MKTKGRVEYQLSCSVRAVFLAPREFKFSGQMGREKKIRKIRQGKRSFAPRTKPFSTFYHTAPQITEGQEEACGIFALCEPATCSHGLE